MSEFKLRSEIDSAGEFIQYLEKLRSGSLVSGIGTNRAFERLAENDNALLEELIRVRWPAALYNGGTVAFTAGNSLSWSGDLLVLLPTTLHTTVLNTIQVASSPQVVPDDSVMYVVLVQDGVDTNKNVVPVVATSAAFIATVAAAPARLDYVVIAYARTEGVIFANGTRLLKGESLTNGLFTDSQYAQQTEATLVRENQKENLNMMLTGGGDITWDEGTTTLSWTQDFVFDFPASAGENTIAGPGSVVIASDFAWYTTLDRDPSGTSVLATATATVANGVPDTDDTFVLAVHRNTDNRVYLADGTALSDAETVKLGGVRIGVQWYYKNAGLGTQTYDFSSLVTPSASYRVGSGELMVYRNGIKALRSGRYWAGVYGTSGAFAGDPSFAVGDDYMEEDVGDGTGTRIIWLADGQAAGEAAYHAASTHDPELEWPTADDVIEVFIGVQGQAPTITLPDNILGFDSIWANSPTVIRTSGGTLTSSGEKYTSVDALDAATTDMFGADSLTASTWHYLYLGPGATPGATPVMQVSTTPPTTVAGGGTGAGRHPSDSQFRFLTSVKVNGSSQFTPFSKNGNRVTLGEYIDLSSVFLPALITNGWEPVDLSGLLPTTGVTAVKMRFLLTSLALVPGGDRVLLEIRPSGFTSGTQEYYAVKPGNSNNVEFVAEFMLDSTQEFEVRLSNAVFNSFAAADLVAYGEGVNTSASDLGV